MRRHCDSENSEAVAQIPLPGGLLSARPSHRVRVVALVFAFAAFAVVIFGSCVTLLLAAADASKVYYVIVAETECGQCYRAAVDQTKSGTVDGVLLLSREHRRLEQLGVVLPIEELARKKLEADGLNRHSIHFIEGFSRSDWETARMLDEWLNVHPKSRVRVLCDRFAGSRWSIILDRNLAGSNRSRASIEGVPDPRYDATNWWRSRIGLKPAFAASFDLVMHDCMVRTTFRRQIGRPRNTRRPC